MTMIFLLSPFQRRISREGLLNEAEVTEIDLDDSMHQLSRGGDGSTDPLLQIPSQLSAVLTLKRGQPANGSVHSVSLPKNMIVAMFLCS